MESPCACSGTLKIFEPGYTFPEEKAKLDVAVTISFDRARGSLEIPRPSYDPENQGFIAASEDAASSNYPECSAASNRGVSCCRYVTIMRRINSGGMEEEDELQHHPIRS
ncbi:hypothetical protein GW17_00034429 [Ensete ventricosum]|nr:hypothetical protein GW17_00034429 [Ensete ventricosum]